VQGLSAVGSYTTNRKRRKVIAARMIVYAGEDEEYFTFMSSEASGLLDPLPNIILQTVL
jgi:hypothetical protein